jgi:hypothetical protein
VALAKDPAGQDLGPWGIGGRTRRRDVGGTAASYRGLRPRLSGTVGKRAPYSGARDSYLAKPPAHRASPGRSRGDSWPGLDAVRVDRMTGHWAIVMNPDGTMTVQAPLEFVGVLEGYRFQPQGSGFRTNRFAYDVCRRFPAGRYTWPRSESDLTFKVAHDRCDARLAFLRPSRRISRARSRESGTCGTHANRRFEHPHGIETRSLRL